jgi:hypothetical protein
MQERRAPARASRGLFLSQAFIATAGLAFVAASPPAEGAMTLIPLSEAAEEGLAAKALSAGTLLLGEGPVPGSLIVRGRRSSLEAQDLGYRVLVTAAPAAGCSSRAAA